MFTINEILDIAIRLEKNSEEVYRRAAAKASKPEIAAALNWAADEEHKHANWLAGLKEDQSVQAVQLAPGDVDGNLLNAVIGKESFSLETVEFADIEHVAERSTFIYFGEQQSLNAHFFENLGYIV